MACKSDIGIMLAAYRGYRSDSSGRVFDKNGREVLGKMNKGGYLELTISKDSRKFTFLKHRFIAFCNYGDEVFKYECVRHLNDIKTDNRPSNLRIGSYRDNYDDRRKNLGMINDKEYN